MLKHSELKPYLFDIFLALGAVSIVSAIFMLSTPILPDIFHYPLILAFFIGFFVFVGFLWKGKHHDEREAEHDAIAGKVAYTIGMAILTIGVAIQSYTHSVDPWMLAVLAIMVVSRMIILIYARLYR